MTSTIRSAALIATLFAIFGGTACANPKVVTKITGGADHMKLVYVQPRTAQAGIIECMRAPDGQLSDCKELEIVFKKKGE